MMKKEQLGAIQKKLAISFKENALRVNFCSHKNAGCKRLFPVFPKFFRDTLIQGRFGGRSSRTCRFSRGKTFRGAIFENMSIFKGENTFTLQFFCIHDYFKISNFKIFDSRTVDHNIPILLQHVNIFMLRKISAESISHFSFWDRRIK